MSRLSDLHKVKNLKSARYWLKLSLRQMAHVIKPQGDRPQSHLSKATIAAWENPRDKRKPDDEQIRKVGVLIANKLTEEMDRTIGVTIKINSPWHIHAHTQCCDCHRWFQMKRDTSRRCARCARRKAAMYGGR
jgi:hypothetical protein